MHKHLVKSQPVCYLSAENVSNEMVVCTFKHDVLHLSNVYVKLNVVHLRQNTTTQIKVLALEIDAYEAQPDDILILKQTFQ